MKSIRHLANIKKHDNWETPKNLFLDAISTFDVHPTLDVCATRKNSKCINYITEKEDSLVFEWKEDVFMNPPYSRVNEFMKKAYYQHKKHGITILILVFAKTDTKFWHSFVEEKAEVHFIKGRIKFLKDGIESSNSAPYPSCWIIYRLQSKKRLNKKIFMLDHESR